MNALYPCGILFDITSIIIATDKTRLPLKQQEEIDRSDSKIPFDTDYGFVLYSLGNKFVSTES